MQLLPQLPPVTSSNGSVTSTSASKIIDSGLFKAQLNARIATVVVPQGQLFAGQTAANPTSGTTTAAASDPLDAKLAAQISARLKNGESLASIVASLSQSLATSVTNAGGGLASDAMEQLQKVFAAALSPPGKAPPSADSALALATRFRQLADIAAKLSEPATTGQPNRFLGPDLDAKAKVDPAPAKTTRSSTTETSGSLAVLADSMVLAAALALGPAAPSHAGSGAATESHGGVAALAAASATALVQPHDADVSAAQTPAGTPPATGSNAATTLAPTAAPGLAAALPIAAMLASDGRTVASGEAKTASNGDTPLGRLLTRALNVSSTRTAAPADLSTRSEGAQTESRGGDLSSFLSSFAAAVAKADESANAASTATPANFLATIDAANAANLATSQPVAPAPIVGIASTAVTPTGFGAIAPPLSYAPATADRYAVVEQVLKGLSIRTLGGVSNSEIRLRLVPDSLGDVNVKLVVNNGQVNATVVAANADVRDTLVANQQHLARSLEGAGLKLTGFSVDVSNGGFAGFNQHQQQQPSTSRGTFGASFDESDGSDDLVIAATPSFAPPQAAGVALGHLNALV